MFNRERKEREEAKIKQWVKEKELLDKKEVDVYIPDPKDGYKDKYTP